MTRTLKVKSSLYLTTCALATALTGWSAAAAATVDTAPTDAPAEAGSAAASPAARADTALGDIVVTARKVKEKLADVPIAISAIGGDQLNQNMHIRLEDLNQLAPSTVVVVTNGHQTTMSIRGIGNNPGSDGLENSAGVFVDGVYLGRPGMVSMDLIDIKQIEELRGPQGTLFGKNTTAGAINITTELPSFEWNLKGAVTYGNYNYQQFQGSITGPITPNLAFRLTGYSTTRNGDVYDVSNGDWVNNLNRNGARAQLLWKPSSDLSIRLIGEYSAEQQSTGALAFVPNLGSQSATLAAKEAAIGGTIITNPHVGMIAKGLVIDPTGAFTAAGGPLQTGTRQGAGSAEINWKLGGFTLTSLTAFRYWQYDSRADSDSSSADALYGGYHIQDRQWTQEVRLAFPRMGNVDLITGLYYFNQHIKTDAHTEYGADAPAYLSGMSLSTLQSLAALYNSNPTQYAAYASIPTVLNYAGKRVNTYADPLTQSIAAFGQAIWHVTPKWNITGGVRVTHETKREHVWSGTTNNDWNITPGAVSVRIADTAPSWLFSTDYHPTRSLMAYFTVSHGEKAGGLNTTQAPGTLPLDQYAVAPETATNYEVGIKGEWFHHRLSATLDLFRMDISNYQANVTQVVPNPSGAGGMSIINPIVSAGAARTQGIEFETTMVPVRGIALHGFVAYNDAKYLSYTSAPCPVEAPAGSTTCDLSGKPIVGAPKWTMGLNGTAETRLGESYALYFSPEISWRSRYFASNDDSIYSVTGNYAVVNLRLGVHDRDRHWDLSLWGRNISNKRRISNYFNYGSLVPGTLVAFFGDPATYGATLRVSM